MKIGGPKGPSPPVEPPAVDATAGGEKARATGFEQLLEPQGTSGATSAPAGDLLAQVSARLRAGEVTRDQAVDLLIEAVIEKKAGVAPPALRQRLQDALRALVAEDPLLGDKVRRLGGGAQ